MNRQPWTSGTTNRAVSRCHATSLRHTIAHARLLTDLWYRGVRLCFLLPGWGWQEMDAERGMAMGPLDAGGPPERRATGGSEEPLSAADIVGGWGTVLLVGCSGFWKKKKGAHCGQLDSSGCQTLHRWDHLSWLEDRTHCTTLLTPLCLNKWPPVRPPQSDRRTISNHFTDITSTSEFLAKSSWE